LKGAGFVWSEKHLFVYLLNPGKYIPGNKMSFAGLSGEQDRANLIAFLKENV
jgi:cytochrome c